MKKAIIATAFAFTAGLAAFHAGADVTEDAGHPLAHRQFKITACTPSGNEAAITARVLGIPTTGANVKETLQNFWNKVVAEVNEDDLTGRGDQGYAPLMASLRRHSADASKTLGLTLTEGLKKETGLELGAVEPVVVTPVLTGARCAP